MTETKTASPAAKRSRKRTRKAPAPPQKAPEPPPAEDAPDTPGPSQEATVAASKLRLDQIATVVARVAKILDSTPAEGIAGIPLRAPRVGNGPVQALEKAAAALRELIKAERAKVKATEPILDMDLSL